MKKKKSTRKNHNFVHLDNNLLGYFWFHLNNSFDQILYNFIARFFAGSLDILKLGFGFFVGFFFGLLVSA